MNVTPPKEITLPMVYMAVLDFRQEVVETLQEQHEELAEGMSLLFKRTDLHSKWLGRLRGRTHAERNAIQIIALRQDQLEKRLDDIDHKGHEQIYDALIEELNKPFKDLEPEPAAEPEPVPDSDDED